MSNWETPSKTSEIANVGDAILDYGGEETVVRHVAHGGAYGESSFSPHGTYKIVKRATEKMGDESKSAKQSETLDSYRLVDTIRVTRHIAVGALLGNSFARTLISLERREAEREMDSFISAYQHPRKFHLLYGPRTWLLDEVYSSASTVVYVLEMPIYEKYQRHTDYRSAPTCDLVDGLIKREGVVEYAISTPDHVYRVQSLDTRVDGATWRTLGPSIGPARILVVTD